MTFQSLHFLVPGIGPAGLPLPPATQALLDDERPVHPLDGAETGNPPPTPDPGSIEFESWVCFLRHMVR